MPSTGSIASVSEQCITANAEACIGLARAAVASAEARTRWAGAYLIGLIAEAQPTFVRSFTSPLVETLLLILSDASRRVRATACCSFVDVFRAGEDEEVEDMAKHAPGVLERVFNLLGVTNTEK